MRRSLQMNATTLVTYVSEWGDVGDFLCVRRSLQGGGSTLRNSA
jgi:hypothetical protein